MSFLSPLSSARSQQRALEDPRGRVILASMFVLMRGMSRSNGDATAWKE